MNDSAHRLVEFTKIDKMNFSIINLLHVRSTHTPYYQLKSFFRPILFASSDKAC